MTAGTENGGDGIPAPPRDQAPHRARHDQYRDLLDVVADIASVDEPATLANRVAEQARRLLHADVVYLWFTESQGDDAYLGATSGGLTSDLRNMRIPAGEAMAGRIITSGLPLIVARYLEDTSFSHQADVDQVMRNEKIVASVGVPLTSGIRTIGALVAANRDERSYTLADVDLLRTLAVHAAILIERTRLEARRIQAISALKSQNRELNRQNTEAAGLHNTFARVALTGGQIGDLVTEVKKIVEGPLAVFDEDGRVLAEAGGFVAAEVTEDLVRSAALTRSTQTTTSVAAVPIATAMGIHGVLCLSAPDGVSESEIQIVERAAVTAALLLLRAEAEARAAGFRRDDFINDLVSGSDDPVRLNHRAAQMKFDLRRPFTVHVARADLQDRRLAHLANEAARVRGGLAGHCREVQSGDTSSVVILLPGLDARTNAIDIADAMKRAARLHVSVAGAGPVRDATQVGKVFEEASACSEAMLRIGGVGMSGTLDDLGFVGLVLGKDRSVRSFVDSTLGPVLTYDAQHHTELMSTLEALLSTDGGPTAAANVLHVHVSTVKQRMRRLQTLLGEDWRSVDRSFELRVAATLHHINPRSTP